MEKHKFARANLLSSIDRYINVVKQTINYETIEQEKWYISLDFFALLPRNCLKDDVKETSLSQNNACNCERAIELLKNFCKFIPRLIE